MRRSAPYSRRPNQPRAAAGILHTLVLLHCSVLDGDASQEDVVERAQRLAHRDHTKLDTRRDEPVLIVISSRTGQFRVKASPCVHPLTYILSSVERSRFEMTPEEGPNPRKTLSTNGL